jgi:hypothetical protein
MIILRWTFSASLRSYTTRARPLTESCGLRGCTIHAIRRGIVDVRLTLVLWAGFTRDRSQMRQPDGHGSRQPPTFPGRTQPPRSRHETASSHRHHCYGASPGRSGGRDGSPRLRNTPEFRLRRILQAAMTSSYEERTAYIREARVAVRTDEDREVEAKLEKMQEDLSDNMPPACKSLRYIAEDEQWKIQPGCRGQPTRRTWFLAGGHVRQSHQNQ